MKKERASRAAIQQWKLADIWAALSNGAAVSIDDHKQCACATTIRGAPIRAELSQPRVDSVNRTLGRARETDRPDTAGEKRLLGSIGIRNAALARVAFQPQSRPRLRVRRWFNSAADQDDETG